MKGSEKHEHRLPSSPTAQKSEPYLKCLRINSGEVKQKQRAQQRQLR